MCAVTSKAFGRSCFPARRTEFLGHAVRTGHFRAMTVLFLSLLPVALDLEDSAFPEGEFSKSRGAVRVAGGVEGGGREVFLAFRGRAWSPWQRGHLPVMAQLDFRRAQGWPGGWGWQRGPWELLESWSSV